MFKPLRGECQCGQVKYQLTAPEFVAYICHCRACQKLSSSAFSICMQVPAEALNITQGNAASRVRVADSGNELTSWFCTACGSALFAQNSARPRIRTLYAGTLDNPDMVPVSAHIWIKRKLPWVVLPQQHRTFDGAGDWTEDYANDMSRYKPEDN